MKRYIFSLIALIVFVSCENSTEIDYQLNAKTDNPIVTGAITMNPRQSWVQVQMPVNPLGNIAIEPMPLDESVKVYLCDETKKLTEFERTDSGYFFLPVNFLPQNKTLYSVKVESNNFEPVTSSLQLIPDAVSIDSVTYELFEWDYLAYKYHIDVYFTDSGAQNNYYRYIHQEYYGQNTGSEIDSQLPSVVYIFSDESSNGESVHIRFDVKRSENKVALDSIQINLLSFSKDLFLLSESLANYDGSIQDSFKDFPSPVYSNIENGYGIFGAYNKTKFVLIIK